ncbi:MAG: Tm-1-like ATP-binding domain-containing protein [Devosia sp.]|nr:Tm-1-like ATP-binding domain-containing protein [Devosia sp.]
MTSTLTFLLPASLDTKGKETGFCRDLIVARGHRCLVIDIGMIGEAEIEPDIDRHAVARAAGTDLAAIALSSKNDGILAMGRGLARITRDLVAAGKANGILGIGGGQGTVMATTAMQGLPFGFPKVMVSAIANGGQAFGPLVGTSDIAIIHSVADILGLNVITRRVLAEGVGAMIGMAETAGATPGEERPAIGLTSAGVTTPAARTIRQVLEGHGIDVIAFHCNGIGAHAMEDLVTEGRIQGVIDLSPKDVIDGLYGGIFPAYPARLWPIRDAAIPCIIVPGTLDFILDGPLASVPPERRGRKFVVHNPVHTHVRATYEEMRAAGHWIVDRLAGSPAAIMIPNKGFTQTNREGGPMFDPKADAGFAAGVHEALAGHPGAAIAVTEYNLHINDPAFATEVAETMFRMLGKIDKDRP